VKKTSFLALAVLVAGAPAWAGIVNGKARGPCVQAAIGREKHGKSQRH